MIDAVGSVDGTKLQANAGKHAAVSYARAGEMIAKGFMGADGVPCRSLARRLAQRPPL